MKVRVVYNSDISEVISVSNGSKQGCISAPTLFSMMLSATLIDAFEGKQGSLKPSYRRDGGFFNTTRIKTTTNVNTGNIRELLYAAECALCAYNEPDMQQVVEDFSAACENFGFTINTKKLKLFINLFPASLMKIRT